MSAIWRRVLWKEELFSARRSGLGEIDDENKPKFIRCKKTRKRKERGGMSKLGKKRKRRKRRKETKKKGKLQH